MEDQITSNYFLEKATKQVLSEPLTTGYYLRKAVKLTTQTRIIIKSCKYCLQLQCLQLSNKDTSVVVSIDTHIASIKSKQMFCYNFKTVQKFVCRFFRGGPELPKVFSPQTWFALGD